MIRSRAAPLGPFAAAALLVLLPGPAAAAVMRSGAQAVVGPGQTVGEPDGVVAGAHALREAAGIVGEQDSGAQLGASEREAAGHAEREAA